MYIFLFQLNFKKKTSIINILLLTNKLRDDYNIYYYIIK
nr:MAG TPA: hypothetical protein [Ackermannviridae sp.]